ncbi:MAG: hypothetical protein ACI87I_001906 [Pseudoalteromonas tetraodonis]|jgi:hypothetical protein
MHKEKTTGFEQRATGRKYNLALFINVDVQLADAKSAALNSSKHASRNSTLDARRLY